MFITVYRMRFPAARCDSDVLCIGLDISETQLLLPYDLFAVCVIGAGSSSSRTKVNCYDFKYDIILFSEFT